MRRAPVCRAMGRSPQIASYNGKICLFQQAQIMSSENGICPLQPCATLGVHATPSVFHTTNCVAFKPAKEYSQAKVGQSGARSVFMVPLARALLLSEKKTKHGKSQVRFLHKVALLLTTKVSHVHCSVLMGSCHLSVFSPDQEQCNFTIVLQHTNNPCNPYIRQQCRAV